MRSKRKFLGLRLRIQALKRRHSLLERELARETGRPAPNSLRAQQLKRRKLQLKDEAARLVRRLERAEPGHP